MPCEETSLSLVTIVWEGYSNLLWRLEMGLSGGGGIGERSQGEVDPNTIPESLSVSFGTARVLVISVIVARGLL